MAKPNSLFTLIRQVIVHFVDPKPDMGEAWCINCVLNGGDTAVFPADGIQKHAIKHEQEMPGSDMTYSARWPPTKKAKT